MDLIASHVLLPVLVIFLAFEFLVGKEGEHNTKEMAMKLTCFDFPQPLSWAQRKANVTYLQYHDRGGHFASHEEPNLLVDDVRAFLAPGTVASQAYLRD